MTTSIFFIVEGQRLEAQAALLVASLRAQNGDAHDLIAYTTPAGRAAMPAPLRDLLGRAGVDLRLLDPVLTLPEAQRFAQRGWRADYPHGNKILAAASPRACDWSMFIDTDIICTAPLDLAALQSPGRLALVPEGVPSWDRADDRWPRAYAHFGLDLPQDRVQLTRHKRLISLPYFNAGMVMFPEAHLPGNPGGFGQLWLETALDFDWTCRIGGKRPWLDQITLPLTLKRFGYDYVVAPTEMNFSVSARAYEPEARPALMHYHRFRYLGAWPQAAGAFAALAKLAGPALNKRLHTAYGAIYADALAPPVA